MCEPEKGQLEREEGRSGLGLQSVQPLDIETNGISELNGILTFNDINKLTFVH